MSERRSPKPENLVETTANHAFFIADLSMGKTLSITMRVYRDKIVVGDKDFSYELGSNSMEDPLDKQEQYSDAPKSVLEAAERIINVLTSKGWVINSPTAHNQKKINQLTSDELIELARLARTTEPLPVPLEDNFPAPQPPRAE